MHNALRADDLYRPVEHALAMSPRKGRSYRIETGLSDGLVVETSDPPIPGFLEALTHLHELKALPDGWDSYAGKSVDPAVYKPALELLVESVRRCAAPRITASSAGGLIMIWENGPRELSIEVAPDGGYEVYAFNEETGEEVDPGKTLTAAEAAAALAEYCRI